MPCLQNSPTKVVFTILFEFYYIIPLILPRGENHMWTNTTSVFYWRKLSGAVESVCCSRTDGESARYELSLHRTDHLVGDMRNKIQQWEVQKWLKKAWDESGVEHLTTNQEALGLIPSVAPLPHPPKKWLKENTARNDKAWYDYRMINANQIALGI